MSDDVIVADADELLAVWNEYMEIHDLLMHNRYEDGKRRMTRANADLGRMVQGAALQRAHDAEADR